jgi:hypothetical protein
MLLNIFPWSIIQSWIAIVFASIHSIILPVKHYTIRSKRIREHYFYISFHRLIESNVMQVAYFEYMLIMIWHIVILQLIVD